MYYDTVEAQLLTEDSCVNHCGVVWIIDTITHADGVVMMQAHEIFRPHNMISIACSAMQAFETMYQGVASDDNSIH